MHSSLAAYEALQAGIKFIAFQLNSINKLHMNHVSHLQTNPLQFPETATTTETKSPKLAEEQFVEKSLKGDANYAINCCCINLEKRSRRRRRGSNKPLYKIAFRINQS